MFVNPIAVVFSCSARPCGYSPASEPTHGFATLTPLGALLATGGMLLLVYTLVKAPHRRLGRRAHGRRAGRCVGPASAAFMANERRHRSPLAPLSIFRINGLGFSNLTQLIAFAGFLAVFFYLTLYMQNVLGYSAIQTGAAYLPLCFAIGIAAGVSSQLLSRVGTRPVIVVGAVIAAAGMYLLSRIPVHGSFLADLLPGMLVLSIGIGPVFVGVATAANAGVPADKAGLAASLLNASQQVGGALGLAIFTAIATSRTQDLLAAHATSDARADGRLPAGVPRRQHLHPRCRGDRAPRHQHARRGQARRRGRQCHARCRPTARLTSRLIEAGSPVARSTRLLRRCEPPQRPPQLTASMAQVFANGFMQQPRRPSATRASGSLLVCVLSRRLQ